MDNIRRIRAAFIFERRQPARGVGAGSDISHPDVDLLHGRVRSTPVELAKIRLVWVKSSLTKYFEKKAAWKRERRRNA